MSDTDNIYHCWIFLTKTTSECHYDVAVTFITYNATLLSCLPFHYHSLLYHQWDSITVSNAPSLFLFLAQSQYLNLSNRISLLFNIPHINSAVSKVTAVLLHFSISNSKNSALPQLHRSRNSMTTWLPQPHTNYLTKSRPHTQKYCMTTPLPNPHRNCTTTTLTQSTTIAWSEPHRNCMFTKLTHQTRTAWANYYLTGTAWQSSLPKSHMNCLITLLSQPHKLHDYSTNTHTRLHDYITTTHKWHDYIFP